MTMSIADILSRIEEFLVKLNSLTFQVQRIDHPSHASPSVVVMPQSAFTSTTASRRSCQRASTGNKLAAPTTTPSSRRIPAPHSLRSLSTQSTLDKVTISMQIPDSAAGYVIGRAGTGLCQITEFSWAKVSVVPIHGPSSDRVITIQGSHSEMGDAIVAIGRQMAGKCVCNSRPKKMSGKGGASQPPSGPVPPPTPTLIPTQRTVPSSQPTETATLLPSMSQSHTGDVASTLLTPMDISTTPTLTVPGRTSPMTIGRVEQHFNKMTIAERTAYVARLQQTETSRSDRPPAQTARRSCGRGGGR